MKTVGFAVTTDGNRLVIGGEIYQGLIVHREKWLFDDEGNSLLPHWWVVTDKASGYQVGVGETRREAAAHAYKRLRAKQRQQGVSQIQEVLSLLRTEAARRHDTKEIVAKGMHRVAFAKQRSPRSQAYKQGCLEGIRSALGLLRKDSPHADGTAEADAWWAGYDEGRQIGRRNNHTNSQWAA